MRNINGTLFKVFLSCLLLFGMSLIHESRNPSCVNAQTCIDMPNLRYEPQIGGHCGAHCSFGLPMGLPTRRMCYLTLTAYEDLDSGGEHSYCRLEFNHSPTQWSIVGWTDGGSNTDAYCYARCIAW